MTDVIKRSKLCLASWAILSPVTYVGLLVRRWMLSSEEPQIFLRIVLSRHHGVVIALFKNCVRGLKALGPKIGRVLSRKFRTIVKFNAINSEVEKRTKTNDIAGE